MRPGDLDQRGDPKPADGDGSTREARPSYERRNRASNASRLAQSSAVEPPPRQCARAASSSAVIAEFSTVLPRDRARPSETDRASSTSRSSPSGKPCETERDRSKPSSSFRVRLSAPSGSFAPSQELGFPSEVVVGHLLESLVNKAEDRGLTHAEVVVLKLEFVRNPSEQATDPLGQGPCLA